MLLANKQEINVIVTIALLKDLLLLLANRNVVTNICHKVTAVTGITPGNHGRVQQTFSRRHSNRIVSSGQIHSHIHSYIHALYIQHATTVICTYHVKQQVSRIAVNYTRTHGLENNTDRKYERERESASDTCTY